MNKAKKNELEIILASASPRRAELLARLGLEFRIEQSELAEEKIERTWRQTGCPGGLDELALRLARAKAEAVRAKLNPEISSSSLIIAADTMVTLGQEILHKPENYKAAVETLRKLAGQTHEVRTAVAISSPHELNSFCSKCEVKFFPLDELMQEEIEHYCQSKSPYDKAGAYGIQEAGAFLVESISGDYLTVVGLPLAKLRRELRKLGLFNLSN